MSRAETIALINSFALDQLDQALVDRAYDDTLRLLSTRPVIIQASTLPVTHDQALFTLPDEAIALHAAFYGDRLLDHMPLDDLEVIHPHWRDLTGEPVAYTTITETERTFRLFPIPDRPSDPFGITLGPPFGLGYPSYTVMIITSLFSDPPIWLELPLILQVLSSLFTLDSRWKDPAFAQGCQQLSTLVESLLART